MDKNFVFAEEADATPLSEEEKQGLIPAYISTRAELNQVEQQNILEAELWAFNRMRNPLQVSFLKELHRRMFGQVWKWAGKLRTSERNLGIPPVRIPIELRQLVDDVQYQMDHNTWPPDEIAVRFHHRLVFIHPFVNGNGRHSRLATDILLTLLGRDRFTWGAGNLIHRGEIRTTYIRALRAADNGDYSPLKAFVRSGTDLK